MSARGDGAALAARIYATFPVTQPAFARLLQLLDIKATDAVSTAAVTLGGVGLHGARRGVADIGRCKVGRRKWFLAGS